MALTRMKISSSSPWESTFGVLTAARAPGVGSGAKIPTSACSSSTQRGGTHAEDARDRGPELRSPRRQGRIDAVTISGPTFQRETLAPGWHWSTHVKPVASGESCQKYHVGIILSGRQRVAMEDRTEVELGPAMSASSSPATTRGVSATSPTCCSSSRRPSAKRRRRHERKGTRTSTGSWRRSGGRRRVGPSPAAAGADGPVHRPPPCSATVAGPNSEEPN
jgi:hypothetical protein